ncbi:MAG: hypothetical protein SFW66_09300 [Gammaproteobacteria bacterium]|nr:hypothetical protein [Gammaproteobacteria bacterium]
MERHDIINFFSILAFILLSTLLITPNAHASSGGYFQLHNLMSAAQKNIPNNLLFNDSTFNLENKEKGTGNVINTQFANDGGMAGCGVTSTLMHYMYQIANQPNGNLIDRSPNYIALNVYSQIMGFDPTAPFWGDPEGSVKGYWTQTGGPLNVGYPNIPYHRVIPSLYPAYLGLFNNGLSCGRWIEANFDTQSCLDRTTPTGISKFCPNVGSLSYTGEKIQGYVFDSCEDNNGWCRDDAPHIDVNVSAFKNPANYYLQWKFIRNPYYADTQAPAYLKDVWLAWFGQASKYWSYVAILNAENGISTMQYNIGDLNSPTWIHSHVLAGDNNITWVSSSNNGQLWQIEPVNSLTDTAPANNPTYQMRMFDYLGYPSNHGAIYQFSLLFQDGTLGQDVGGFSLFYQGGLRVKPGAQTQNMTINYPSTGNGKIILSFNTLLPGDVSLDITKSNYIRPVLISDEGYAYDPTQCTTANNQCTFSGLPTATAYHLFAHAVLDVSNDLTLRKVNDVSIYSNAIKFNGQSTVSYSLSASELNLSTLYSARIAIPLKFATTSTTSMNGNLQALFVPDPTKNNVYHVTAQTQGCFLNTYVNNLGTYYGNTTICTVYYTANHLKNFTATTPPAFFKVILPSHVGISPVNYALTTTYYYAAQVTGYNPPATPTVLTAPIANYIQSTAVSRSLYVLLDPQSDSNCLQNLDPATGVSVTLGNTPAFTITTSDVPIEKQISQSISNITTQVNLKSGTSLNCQPMLAIVPNSTGALVPGYDVVEVIKLVAFPVAQPPQPTTQGIAATATGGTQCLGATDTLLFSNSGSTAATVPYLTNALPTNVGVKVNPGNYTISDKPFNVAGGTCQLITSPTVTIQANTYTPVTLNYQFTKSPSSTCTAVAKVTGTWPNGCTVQFSLSSTAPLSGVTLSWQKGAYNWNNVQIWSGEGSLTIPTSATGNVTWLLPSWVSGQGSSVGLNINNDDTPAICTAFGNTTIVIGCSGVAN